MGITSEKREERRARVGQVKDRNDRVEEVVSKIKEARQLKRRLCTVPCCRRRQTGGCLQRFESFRRRNSRTGRLMAKPFVGPTALIVNRRQGAADRPTEVYLFRSSITVCLQKASEISYDMFVGRVRDVMPVYGFAGDGAEQVSL
jgi:hypothetical protein